MRNLLKFGLKVCKRVCVQVRSPLLKAVQAGQADIVKALLDHDPGVNIHEKLVMTLSYKPSHLALAATRFGVTALCAALSMSMHQRIMCMHAQSSMHILVYQNLAAVQCSPHDTPSGHCAATCSRNRQCRDCQTAAGRWGRRSAAHQRFRGKQVLIPEKPRAFSVN